MKTLFALAFFALSSIAHATACYVSVAANPSDPLDFRHELWTFNDVGDEVRRIIISKDLLSAVEVSETQAGDASFLKSHDGETVITIARPYPNDKALYDFALTTATVDLTATNFRAIGSSSLGSVKGSKEYGLRMFDFPRHVAVACFAHARKPKKPQKN